MTLGLLRGVLCFAETSHAKVRHSVRMAGDVPAGSTGTVRKDCVLTVRQLWACEPNIRRLAFRRGGQRWLGRLKPALNEPNLAAAAVFIPSRGLCSAAKR